MTPVDALMLRLVMDERHTVNAISLLRARHALGLSAQGDDMQCLRLYCREAGVPMVYLDREDSQLIVEWGMSYADPDGEISRMWVDALVYMTDGTLVSESPLKIVVKVPNPSLALKIAEKLICRLSERDS